MIYAACRGAIQPMLTRRVGHINCDKSFGNCDSTISPAPFCLYYPSRYALKYARRARPGDAVPPPE